MPNEPSPEELAKAERIVLMCMGVSEGEAVSNSVLAKCADCATTIWVSPSGLKLMREYQKMVPLCPRCAEPFVSSPQATIVAPTDAQLDEVILYALNHPWDINAAEAALKMAAMAGMKPTDFRAFIKQRVREQKAKQ